MKKRLIVRFGWHDCKWKSTFKFSLITLRSKIECHADIWTSRGIMVSLKRTKKTKEAGVGPFFTIEWSNITSKSRIWSASITKHFLPLA